MKLIMELDELKKKFIEKKNIIPFAIIFLIFICDRIFKIVIIDNFSDNSYFINEIVNFNLIWNTGVGFGLLSSESSFFYNSITILIFLIVLVLFYALIVSKNSEKKIYAIIIGGAIGNLYDRFYYNAVPDFIDLHYNSYHWFTFNIADIFITLGIILFVINDFFIKTN
tara:strand:- start:263 stop:766 length:504 start_codon:yes stop_codon:yes gene_type:complete